MLADLRDAGGLRPGLTVDQAADTVWAMNSPELHVMLTVDRGWSPLRFERWLADIWCRLLLDWPVVTGRGAKGFPRSEEALT